MIVNCLGVFPVVKPPSNVRTRETQLGLLGSNHFTVNQPHGHIEFNRYLVPPNNDAFQQFKSQPLFVFSNPRPGEFKKQNDEYTRHLVPPPLAKQNGIKFEDNIASVSQTVSNLQNVASNQFGLRPPQLQDNLIIQTSEAEFDSQKQFKPKEHATDVQVTKENFKDFHANLPGMHNPTLPDYVDFDFHSISTPGQLPKLQTYEVTEGGYIKIIISIKTLIFSYRLNNNIQVNGLIDQLVSPLVFHITYKKNILK